MLSSTAANLYWIGRNVERASNTASLLKATHRMWLMAGGAREWRSMAATYGVNESFGKKFPNKSVSDLLSFMALDGDNPSSILTSIRSARSNARTERNNLTVSVWEYLNDTWLALRDRIGAGIPEGEEQEFLDWVRERTSLINGALTNTLLRDEAYDFLQLGVHIERADNTARILDSKYHILLPQGETVGGHVDYYQWSEILACVNALRTYRRVYSSAIFPWRVAELLILREDLPRSLHFCLKQIDSHLVNLAGIYGSRHESHRLAGKLHGELRYGKVDDLFTTGLHEFLVEFIKRNNQLGQEIAENYLFAG
ncbi:alpha-E domain-containing protein [Lacibacterium aquatile]|uniref:Alpha-E domain-containing protein n=1 Tax=Lacibacterium aquatile TaxID=1168082 RepID=A0ABW5DZK7_9PROT